MTNITGINKNKDWSEATAEECLKDALVELSKLKGEATQQRAIVILIHDKGDGTNRIQAMNSAGLASYEIRGLLSEATDLLGNPGD